jgi:hypothetical protein
MRSFWTWLKAGMPTRDQARDLVLQACVVALLVNVVIVPVQFFVDGRVHPVMPGIIHDAPPAPPPEADGAKRLPDGPTTYATGWVPRPDAVAEVAGAQQFKVFADTPAGKATADEKDVFLWNAWNKALGNIPPPRNQSSIGSCVSFGTSAAVDCLIAISFGLGTSGEYHDTVQEAVYGGSRVQIGKGRLGSGDGSVGAWAAQWVKDYGVIARGKVGSYDLSTYSVARCRQWGNQGCPKDLLEVAREHPVKGIAQVTSAEAARKALLSGYPIAVCSNQGFTSTRDADGFARPSGQWAHCMAILGYRADRKGFFVWNSWGADWIKGPLGAGSPPEGGFWADWQTIDGMTHQGDTWAFSDVAGFGKRRLNWLISAPIQYDARARGLRDTLLTSLTSPFAPSRRAYYARDHAN